MMLEKIRRWWRGRYNEESLSRVFGESDESYEEFTRPLLARFLLPIFGFVRKEWKWLFWFGLAILALPGISEKLLNQ